MLVDSHCHLDLIDPELGGVDHLLAEARLRDVGHFLCVSVGLENVGRVREIASQHPNVFASAGIHPNGVAEQQISAEQLLGLASFDEVVAIGETGLDYFRSDNAQQQQQQMALHVGVARELGKPLIIHMRDAAEDTLTLLENEKADQVGGVMHCFVDDMVSAQRAMDLGFMISFSGIVTFKSAKALQQVARQIPTGSLLVETDSPWLAPVPWRGKTNQPAYVHDVASYLAELRQEGFDELSKSTSDNFFRLFKFAQRDAAA